MVGAVTDGAYAPANAGAALVDGPGAGLTELASDPEAEFRGLAYNDKMERFRSGRPSSAVDAGTVDPDLGVSVAATPVPVTGVKFRFTCDAVADAAADPCRLAGMLTGALLTMLLAALLVRLTGWLTVSVGALALGTASGRATGSPDSPNHFFASYLFLIKLPN